MIDTLAERRRYEIEYQTLPRMVRITFDADFPHRIRAWEEVDTESGRVTRAELLVSDQRAYWSQNKRGDRSERSRLQLPENHQ
jgi:hypothetical protein